jgi:hypothetical protein
MLYQVVFGDIKYIAPINPVSKLGLAQWTPSMATRGRTTMSKILKK